MPEQVSVSPSESAVGLFIDWEILVKCVFAVYERSIGPSDAADALVGIAERMGPLRVARAYGDWAAQPEVARELRHHQIDPVLALGKLYGGDSRAGIELGFDLLTWILTKPGLETVVLVTGDADQEPLVRRIKESGRRLILVGIRKSTAMELMNAADQVVWLDDHVDFREGPQQELDIESYDWGPFVKLISSLEETLEFVGLNYLAKRVLSYDNCGYSDYASQHVILREAQETGIIEVYQVPNVEDEKDPVSACRLDPDHPVVQGVLARG